MLETLILNSKTMVIKSDNSMYIKYQLLCAMPLKRLKCMKNDSKLPLDNCGLTCIMKSGDKTTIYE